MSNFIYFFKKHSFVSLLLVFFISVKATAQKPILLEDFKRSVGEKYKRIKSTNTYQIAHGDGMASIKKGRKDMTIQRYSLKTLKEDVSKRQLIEDKGVFQTVLKLGGKAIVFYTVKDKAYAQPISITEMIAQKPIMVGSDKENINNDFGFKSTYGFDAGGRINKFGFKKSFDGKKLLVLFRVQTPDNKPDKIGIAVYDESLKLVWKRKVTMPHPSAIMKYEDFAIDNQGTFFMTASIFESEENKKDKLTDAYTTEVYRIMNTPKDIVQNKLELGDHSVVNAVIQVENDNTPHVTGLYAANDNKPETVGVFSAKIEVSGSLTMRKAAIPQDILQDLTAKRESRINEGTQDSKDLKDLEKLRINHIEYNPDKSVILFAEQRYVEAFTTSSSSGSRTTYKFYYRDAFVFKIDKEGTMTWMKKLPKYQTGSKGKRSMSYRYFRNAGKHYLFYVDNFVNLKRSIDEFPSKYFDGKKDFHYLTAYIINDATGEAEKKPIVTGSNIRNARLDMMALSKMVIMPNKDMIFEIFDGKKNNLLFKIALNKEQ